MLRQLRHPRGLILKALRFLYRPVAAAIGLGHAYLRRRRDIAQARLDAERLLRDHAQWLAAGEWSLLITRKRYRGLSLDRLRKKVEPMLVLRGAVEASDALRAFGFDPERRDIWSGGWSGFVSASTDESRGPFHPTVVLPRRSEKYLLFDFSSRKVLRVSPEGFSPEYERLRRAFSAHVPSVEFEVLPGRDGIVEPFIEGSSLQSVDEDLLLSSVAELLERLPEVSREFGEGDSIERLTTAVDVADSAFASYEVKDEIAAWLGTASEVPAHGDLVGVNVIVTEQGPVCIDFGATKIRPAWFDGLKLALHSIRRLEGSKLEGALDPLLYEFLHRTIPLPPPRNWRMLAALGYRRLTGQRMLTGPWVERLD